MTVCKNCDNQFDGNYCGKCGQKATVERFTLKEIFHGVYEYFVHVDRGFFKLAIDLVTRPGEIARNYLSGQRKKYYNPITFLILVTAVTVFLNSRFHILDQNIPNANRVSLSSSQGKLMTEFSGVVNKYNNIMMFMSVPVFAFFTRLFFRKSGYNYAENLIMQAFYSAERSIFYIVLFFPLLLLFPSHSIAIMYSYSFVWMAYFCYSYSRFFEFKGFWPYVKAVLSILLSFFTFMILILAIFIIFFHNKS